MGVNSVIPCITRKVNILEGEQFYFVRLFKEKTQGKTESVHDYYNNRNIILCA